jgi:hypothetical protein
MLTMRVSCSSVPPTAGLVSSHHIGTCSSMSARTDRLGCDWPCASSRMTRLHPSPHSSSRPSHPRLRGTDSTAPVDSPSACCCTGSDAPRTTHPTRAGEASACRQSDAAAGCLSGRCAWRSTPRRTSRRREREQLQRTDESEHRPTQEAQPDSTDSHPAALSAAHGADGAVP